MTELITLPGDSLLGPQEPQEAARRFGEFLDLTGLEASEVAVSALVSIPLPIYPPEWSMRHRRWKGVRPEAMSNPLMWLPNRVAGRYTVIANDSEDAVESLDEWSVRVCLELTATGFYDPETGQWFDVLAEHGLDISEPETIERVSHWLSGEPDEVLDSIDLTDSFDVIAEPDDFGFEAESPDDPKDWGLRTAAALVHESPATRSGPGPLRIIAWAVHSAALADFAQDLMAQEDFDLDEMQDDIARLMSMCDGSLAGSTDIPGVPDYPAYRAQWSAAADKWDGFQTSLMNSIVAPIAKGLGEIQSFYWAQMEQMSQADKAS